MNQKVNRQAKYKKLHKKTSGFCNVKDVTKKFSIHNVSIKYNIH